jgi:hypothetical protein
MGLFDTAFSELKQLLGEIPGSAKRQYRAQPSAHTWPGAGGGDLVLASDVGVELGNPRDESVSLVVWTRDREQIDDGRITLVGPDLPEGRGMSLPFGKIMLVAGDGLDETDGLSKYRELEGLRFEIDLKGYMIRAASPYQKEWVRVSRAALDGGLTFSIVGDALLRQFKRKEYISVAEVLFVTSGEYVQKLKPVAAGVGRIIGALGKMADEMSLDCDSCEYVDVCDEVDALRQMREKLRKGAH